MKKYHYGFQYYFRNVFNIINWIIIIIIIELNLKW